MKYKVLYRKYRPDTFDNIIGQDYIITTLKNSIKNNNISHAYIFSGPRGTGKTTTAKVFSKAINCLNPIDGSPCGKCEFCLNFNDNPDIIEIDAASNNGVDEIRQLIDNIKITPTNGKYKVYIIDEVHMLTTSAFNALLLTLEEPPAHAIFILATTNIENVPITILSRCQRYDFQKITVEDIVKKLSDISKIENIKIEEEALYEIAYLSEGGLRDALSLLDQLSKSGEKISLDFVEKQIKTISKKNLEEFIESIENNDLELCLNLINEFRKRAVDYKTLAKKIIDNVSLRAKKIALTGNKKRLDLETYKKLILDIVDTINKININVDSYTILEMVLLEYFDTEKSNITSSEVVENEDNKEIDNHIENSNLKENIDINSLIKIRVNNCFYGAQKRYLEKAKNEIETCKLSPNIVGKVKSILMDSVIVAASNTNLIFTIENEHKAETANKCLKEIESAINNELKSSYKIIFLDTNKWQKEKEEYIINLKNNKKYEYIEETEEKEDVIINDIFDLSKVEIV